MAAVAKVSELEATIERLEFEADEMREALHRMEMEHHPEDGR